MEWSLRDCDTGAELPFPALFLDDYKGSFPLLMPRFSLISSIFKTGIFVLREKNAAPNIGHFLARIMQPSFNSTA